MTNKPIATSPQVYARTGGALYLAIIVLGAFAEGFVANKLVVPGDAATSGYFPKFIGILMQVAGFCYLLACFAALFASAPADLITPAILLPPLIGESSFCLWLLIKGVDISKWNERLVVGYGSEATGST
jgi:hypothetical protein